MPATVTAACRVLLDHLPRIHTVDVVGAEYADVIGPLVVQQVEVLEDRLRSRRTTVGLQALRRHGHHVVAEQRREPPRRRDVTVERMALYCVSTTILK